MLACKVSGVVASAPAKWTADDLAPVVKHGLETFGPDRVMFGSDWPVCTQAASYRQWVTALRKIAASWSDERRHNLFYGNAARLVRILGQSGTSILTRLSAFILLAIGIQILWTGLSVGIPQMLGPAAH